MRGGGGPHVTITHDALDLTVQGPPTPDIRNGLPPGTQTSDMGPHLRTHPTSTDIWWLKQVRWQTGGTHPTAMLSCLRAVSEK